MIGGLIAPFIGKRINFKKLFVASAICYAVNMASGIVLHYIGYSALTVLLVEIMAMIGGGSAALLWVSQAAYIHYIC